MCLTTSSIVYDYENDEVYSPEALLALQGLPVKALKFDDLSASDRTDLAGEAMFAANVGSLIMAVFLGPAGPWWSEQSSD